MKKNVLIILSALSVLISCNRSTSPSVIEVETSPVDSTNNITDSVFVSNEVDVNLPIVLSEGDGLALYDELRVAFFQKEYDAYLMTREMILEYDYNYTLGELGSISVTAIEAISQIQYANFVNLYLSETYSDIRSITAFDLPFSLDLSSEITEKVEYYDTALHGVVYTETYNGQEEYSYFNPKGFWEYIEEFSDNLLENNGASYDFFTSSDLEEVLTESMYYNIDFFTNEKHDSIKFVLSVSVDYGDELYMYDITATITNNVFDISGTVNTGDVLEREKLRIDLYN
jgi:hypothetical protein